MQDDHGNRFCGQVVHSITDRTHSERVAPRANIAVQQLPVIIALGDSSATRSMICQLTNAHGCRLAACFSEPSQVRAHLRRG